MLRYKNLCCFTRGYYTKYVMSIEMQMSMVVKLLFINIKLKYAVRRGYIKKFVENCCIYLKNIYVHKKLQVL